MTKSRPAYEPFLLIAIVGLTLATGYIHFYVGGIMLLLNSAGYATLAAATVITALFFHRFLPLVLAALAVYAAVTIIGWLIMGPYFDIAYLAKVIEIILISSIIIELRALGDETPAAFDWLFRTLRIRRPTKAGAEE